MTEKYIQTPKELERHLEDQIKALRRSAEGFDAGDEFEAKRIALSIRLLVHDTSSSTSLLTQLSKKDIQFYDTSLDVDLHNRMTQNGIAAILLTPGGSSYIAPLDGLPPPGPAWVDFATWWDREIFVDKQKRVMTRRDLVLSVADQDGGAHVDPKIGSTYADLSRGNSLAWISTDAEGNDSEMEGPEKAALRQLAHEVLKSLDPAMATREPNLPEGGAMFIGGRVTVEEAPDKHPSVPKVGRNAPCPCGSGLKYKKCGLRLR